MEHKPTDQIRVKCEICLKEIPRSEAKSAEAVDYVLYFCGLDCFEKWQNSNRLREWAVGGD
jgi:hypothetical protein